MQGKGIFKAIKKAMREHGLKYGGADGARTRDLRRDRPAL